MHAFKMLKTNWLAKKNNGKNANKENEAGRNLEKYGLLLKRQWNKTSLYIFIYISGLVVSDP